MSFVDQLRRPRSAEFDDQLSYSVDDPFIAQPSPAWAVVTAGSFAFISASLASNLGRGALSGALVAAIVGLLLIQRRRLGSIDLVRSRLVGIGIIAGAFGGGGSVLTAGASSATRTICQLGLGWASVALLLRPDPYGLESTTIERRTRIRMAAMVSVTSLVVTGLALVARATERPAAEFAAAVPIGLVLFFVASVWERSPADTFSRTVRGAAAGIVAAILASVELAGRSIGAPFLGALMLVTIAALALLTVVRFDIVLPSWALLGGMALALIGAGAGPGPLALAGFAGAIALERRGSRLTAVSQAPAPIDTSDTTARRVVVGLSTLALMLRLLTFRGLWLDEATSVHQARLPFVDMLRLIYTQDNHPPLSQIVLWLDVRLIGDSEFALRLPEVIIGSLLIPMLYITGRELFDRRVGLFAAAIGTVAPIAVWYGQEARMYAQFMLLALIVVYAQARILKGGRARYWVLFTLASVALIYTQYFSVLHVAATLAVFALAIIRRRRRGARHLLQPLLISLAVQAVLLAPLVPFALHQAVHNQQSGFGFSTTGLAAGTTVVPAPGIYGLLTNIQWAIWGYQPTQLTTRLVALWPIGLLVLLLLLGKPRRNANRSLLLIAGLPVLAVFGASFIAAKSRSLAEVRYVAGAVPLLFLLLAAGVTTVVSSRRVQQLVIGGLLVSMACALFVQETSTQNPRLYQYREAVARVRDDARPDDQLIYAPHYMDYVLEYYKPGITSTSLEGGLATKPTGKVFLLDASSFADSDAAGAQVSAAVKKLEQQGMTVKAKYTYAEVTVWELG